MILLRCSLRRFCWFCAVLNCTSEAMKSIGRMTLMLSSLRYVSGLAFKMPSISVMYVSSCVESISCRPISLRSPSLVRPTSLSYAPTIHGVGAWLFVIGFSQFAHNLVFLDLSACLTLCHQSRPWIEGIVLHCPIFLQGILVVRYTVASC